MAIPHPRTNRPLSTSAAKDWPFRISSERELDEVLTRPSAQLVRDIQTVRSPLVLLGAGGKMGPSLAVLAARAAREAGSNLEIIAVSRFRDAPRRKWLQDHGVTTVQADLLNASSYRGLPHASDVLYLVGQKFGTTASPTATWTTNTLIPAWSMRRYPQARFVVLSTGNVYPLCTVRGRGAAEHVSPLPIGEYASAALARERIFEWHGEQQSTAGVILRLNYSSELRYGVPADIASKVWRNEAIPLQNGWFNCIWQRDANEAVLRSLELASNPIAIFNLTGLEKISVRQLAKTMASKMGRRPHFKGRESKTALLSDARRLHQLLKPEKISCSILIDWVTQWVMNGLPSYDKPTHFEVRDGKY